VHRIISSAAVHAVVDTISPLATLHTPSVCTEYFSRIRLDLD
jgi:hypothetical protein